MRKFFVSFVFCVFLSGCQNAVVTPSSVEVTSSAQQTEQSLPSTTQIPVSEPAMLDKTAGKTPADQFTKTGMARSIYSQQQADAGALEYLMHQSQEVPTTTDDKQKQLTALVQDCRAQGGLKMDKCYENFVQERTKIAGPEAAFADLKKLYDMSGDVKAYCHPLSHAIGHAAVDKYPDVNDAYEHGNDFCWSGYYHGVMEEFMDRIGSQNLVKELDNICAKMPGKSSYSFQYYNCVHGLGHGLMDVMGDKLRDALKMCDNLTGSWEQQSCYSGIFMQNVINDGLEYHTADLNPADTVYPCNDVDQKYKDVCYLMQTSYMLKINHYNFSKTFEICSSVDKGFEVTCYRSLGRDASGSTVSDIEKTRTNCLLGKDYEQQSECFVGAVKDFVSYYHSDVKAKQLCATLNDSTHAVKAIDGDKMADYCLQTVVGYYSVF